MTMSFQATFKTCFCLIMSVLLTSPVAASEVCQDFKAARLALEKYDADPAAVLESRSVSTNAMFGFPNCRVQYTQNGLNALEHVCEYKVDLPPAKAGEDVMAAQDVFLTDLASELKSCTGFDQSDESVSGMVGSHFGYFMFQRFDEGLALGVDITGGIGDDKYQAQTAITYLKKRRN